MQGIGQHLENIFIDGSVKIEQGKSITGFDPSYSLLDSIPEIKYILVYKSSTPRVNYFGEKIRIEKVEIDSNTFTTIESLLRWLNDGYFFGEGNVRLQQDDIIGIYDIHTAKEIKLNLITEEKKEEEKVQIQEKKWTERHYEVIKSKTN